MDDATPRAGAATALQLAAELLTINVEVEAGARDLERLTRLPEHPDGATLSTARLRFSRALRRHLQLMDGVLLPHLRVNATFEARAAIDAYRKLLHDYHAAAAHHVARWPSTSVAADWQGYYRSVGDMLVRLRRRAEAERRDIEPLLRKADRR